MNLNALKVWLLPLLCVTSPILTHGRSLSYTNATFITINDSFSLPTLATPYPSSIQVTGLTGLVVTKVTITLNQFSHSFPSDVHLLLVGPQNQSLVLMSETGGQDKFSVTNLIITLDDDAATPLPLFESLSSGTFQPTSSQVPLDFAFPPPAPVVSSNYFYKLSGFKGSDPTGTWRLFVIDYGYGDAGSIAGGWTMNFSVAVPLKIARSQTGVVISWPVSAGNCALQSRTNMSGATSWVEEPIVPVVAGGQNFVTNSAPIGGKYYRLIQY